MLQVVEHHQVITDDGGGYGLGEPHVYEPFTEDRKQLFNSMQKEHGRCIGKVYQDAPDDVPDPIGWVFQKRRKYEDSSEHYTHEVWVILREVLSCQ